MNSQKRRNSRYLQIRISEAEERAFDEAVRKSSLSKSDHARRLLFERTDAQSIADGVTQSLSLLFREIAALRQETTATRQEAHGGKKLTAAVRDRAQSIIESQHALHDEVIQAIAGSQAQMETLGASLSLLQQAILGLAQQLGG